MLYLGYIHVYKTKVHSLSLCGVSATWGVCKIGAPHSSLSTGEFSAHATTTGHATQPSLLCIRDTDAYLSRLRSASWCANCHWVSVWKVRVYGFSSKVFRKFSYFLIVSKPKKKSIETNSLLSYKVLPPVLYRRQSHSMIR